jgi:hypothetical protein
MSVNALATTEYTEMSGLEDSRYGYGVKADVAFGVESDRLHGRHYQYRQGM